MAVSLRCRISGCDRDACGVCRRCGDSSESNHAWKEIERDEPCTRRSVCERCEAERRQPDHDWQSRPAKNVDGVELKCARCGLAI